MFTRHMYHKIKSTYKTKHDPAFPCKEEQTTEKYYRQERTVIQIHISLQLCLHYAWFS